MNSGRITLLVREWPDVDAGSARPGTMVVDSLDAARFAIRTQALEMSLDIGRVVVDRAASPIECLSFLAFLPHEFGADVLLIVDDREAFLSAIGRGGDRVLYALSPSDVAFYLATHNLLGEEVPTLPLYQGMGTAIALQEVI